jgi:hypothetical protein
VADCTFFQNSTPLSGGAISNFGTLTVTNCTFSGNSAGYVGFGGGGIFNAAGTAAVTNTVLTNSPSGGNCLGPVPVTDGGHNLDDGTTCGFLGANGSLNNTNPLLDPAGLANNGGTTQTVALQPGSPAINAGDETVCAAAPVNDIDQRGYLRPGMGATNCSIGAYEYNSSPGCCQCPASCAATTNGVCEDGCTAVFDASCQGGALCVLDTPTPSPTPEWTLSNNDCCQCAGFCAAPIVGTCGGCAAVFGASCAGGLCETSTPTNTPTQTVTPTKTVLPSPTYTPTPTPTAKPCVGDCGGNHKVEVNDIITLVAVVLGNAQSSACSDGLPSGVEVNVALIIQAVNNVLNGCAAA